MFCKQSKKILTGVYGGSFNPIHLGHTSMAEEILRQGLVEEMWLVVSPQNPLKDTGLWDDDLRLALAREAVRDLSGVDVCDVEFHLPKPNYMFTTLSTLSSLHPDREFVLVIGQDNWDCFHRWHRWQEILTGYRVIVLPRQQQAGEDCSALPRDNGVIGKEQLAARGVCFPSLPLINLSSTWIRQQISTDPLYDGEGLSPRVWSMIRKNKLEELTHNQ